MRSAASLQNTAAKSPQVSKSSHVGLLLQRKCACGGSLGASGMCEECQGKRLQRKLSIGASDDPLETEADRVADQVLAAPAHSAVSGSPPRIQRSTGQATGDAGAASAGVDCVLSGSGRPLEPGLRQDMEQRFDHDFSNVRVHSGTAAEQSARDVNAHAYTIGQNVVFGAGRFAPGTHEGRRLLAHELTHVVQQSGADRFPMGGMIQREATAAAPVPTMTSGSVNITETPLTVVQQGGQILANSMGFKISKPFTVSASAKIAEPPDAEPFEYGLVQNIFFDHIEEVYSDGDMLVDQVGPMLDSDPDNLSEGPFIHGNATMPSILFTTKSVGPSYTDIPSMEVMLKKLHCKKRKFVDLQSVVRSTQFRVGLAAHGLKSGRLVPLGTISTTYGYKWQVGFVGPSFKSTDASNLKGSYPLSTTAMAVVTDGAVANTEGQAALNAESANMEERCENVL